jgi:hypothetical protein
MAPFHAAVATVPAERRGAERSRLECPAQLHLTVGIRLGSLWDLSTTGARFETDNPPPVGMTALLKWQDYEAFCKIVRVTPDSCGLMFDRPLSSALVDDSVEEEIKRRGPIAAVGNIPLGQKRSRP